MQRVSTQGSRIFYRLLISILFVLYLCYSGLAQATARQGEKKVTLSASQITLKDVFKAIRKQTGLTVMVSGSTTQVKLSERVNVSFRNTPIDEVMSYLLKGRQNVTYSIVDDGIIIEKEDIPKKTGTPPTNPNDTSSTAFTLTGKVTDELGNPLIGATVVVKGSQHGVTTDGQGDFTLPNARNGIQLLVSNVGYETRELPIKGKSVLIKLPIVIQSLDETIVKGYYSTTRRLNTGTVSKISSKEISQQPIADPIVALEGRVPGLYIYQSSGIPGSNVNVSLRGMNSIANGNIPLYIIDGVPFLSTSLTNTSVISAAGAISPFSSLRMHDIESIEILKDADATAIYGSRGANGVILITTKKGKPGKTRFDVNVYHGFGKISNKLDLMNTGQYLKMRQEAMANDGITAGPSDYDVNGEWDTIRYTDWQKVMIGGTANIVDAQGTLSGGNSFTQFLLSGGYRRETTVFPGNSNVQTGSGHININHRSEDSRLKANILTSYVVNKSSLPFLDFTNYVLLAPNAPRLYNEDGSLNWQNSSWTNPLASLEQKSTSTTNNLNTSIDVAYTVFKNFNIRGRGGYNDIRMESINLNPASRLDPSITVRPSLRSQRNAQNTVKSWILEPSIDYSLSFGENKIESLLGTTFQQTTQSSQALFASGFESDALIKNTSAATTLRILNKDGSKYRYSSLYARIGYSFKEKYILNLTGRSDASSRFGPGKQIGYFGAVGGAWIFSREQFIKNHSSFLSFGKLRASYGTTGNDQLGNYKYLSTYTPNNSSYQGISGLIPTQLTNPDFSWETVKKLEAGLDLGFKNDNILFGVTWYRNRTGNQLVGYSLPITTGFDNVQANLPAVIQNTGFEFEISSRNINGRDFQWQTAFNLTIPKNKLISYPNIEGSSYATTYVVGDPLFVRFRYQYLGLDHSTNIYTFEDMDKDGNISYTEDRSAKFVGQKFFGGMNNTLTYKGIELNMFIQFVKQNGYKLTSAIPGTFLSEGSNQLTSLIKDRETGVAQVYTANFDSDASQAFYLYQASNGVIHDASFIRLKTISLSWNIGQYLPSWLNAARIYVNAQNLLTITSYKGFDPELQADANQLSLPPLKMMAAGIQLTF